MERLWHTEARGRTAIGRADGVYRTEAADEQVELEARGMSLNQPRASSTVSPVWHVVMYEVDGTMLFNCSNVPRMPASGVSRQGAHVRPTAAVPVVMARDALNVTLLLWLLGFVRARDDRFVSYASLSIR